MNPMLEQSKKSEIGNRLVKILLFLVPFVYVAVVCNSVSGQLFWSDDPEEMHFVKVVPFRKIVFGYDVFGYFRPVKNLFWFVFSRLEPFGLEWCHVLAIAVGILSFYPVLAFCRRIFEDERKALAAAAVWLLSPTLVSSVAWLSCINIQAMAAFAALAFVFHDKAWEGGSFHSSRVLLAGCFLFLSLVSYECAVSVAPLLFLFDALLRKGRLRLKDAWSSHVFYWLLLVLYLAVRHACSAKEATGGRWIEATRAQLIASSPYFTVRHFADWFWPFGRFSVGGSYIWGEVSPAVLAGCAAFGAIVLLFAFISWNKCPRLSFCLFLAIVGFAPTGNYLGLGNGPFGYYYLALASIGLSAGCVEIVWLLAEVRGFWRIPALAVVVVVILVRLAAVPESARWALLWSREDLAYDVGTDKHPESVQNQLGHLALLMGESRWDEALEIGRRIEAKVGPESPFMHFVYVSRLLHATMIEKNKELACDMLKRFGEVYIEPEKEKQILFYEALICYNLDDDAETAEKKFEQALQGVSSDTFFVGCASSLAKLKAARGEWGEAISLWERAHRVNPNSMSVLWNLAIAYHRVGRESESLELLGRIRKLTGNPELELPEEKKSSTKEEEKP